MPQRPAGVLERVERLLTQRVRPAIERATAPLDVAAWVVPGEPVPFATAAAAGYEPLPVGGAWGAPWGTTWFRVRGRTPEGWRGADGALPVGTRAELVVDLGFTSGMPGFQAEGLVLAPDGRAIEGIAPRRHSIPGAVDADGAVDVLIEAAANPDVIGDLTFVPTPLGDTATAGAEPLYRLRRVDVALVDLAVRELAVDLTVLAELAAELGADRPRHDRLLAALTAAVDALDPDDIGGTAAAARAVLAPELARPAHASAQLVTAVGHAHIDSAWLWPVRETRRKVARTVANVLALMDEDPGLVHAMSSAQQYAWLQETHPDLFARVADRAREGRFVPVGGMWVESDTNLPGGEALARQLVAGTRWFREALGAESAEVWLPDSFGYTAALPQLARLAGKRYLLTQKTSWNDTNRMPHHTFRWEGVDGSRILAHFPPADTYNSEVTMADLAYSERNFADGAHASRTMLLYGYGDGGGGPTRDMAARIARTGSLEGAPRVAHGTPGGFFEAAEAEALASPEGDAPVWSGELYLELHRGTYTSQRQTKQGNRRNEHLLREAELWAATAAIRARAPYPAADLERLWRRVLLLQFHDILPGSAIAWVHREAVADHAAITEELEGLIGASLAALAGDGPEVLLANAAPHARDGVAALAIGPADASPASPVREDADGFVLDDGTVRARIDRDGLLVSLVDAATGREAVPPGERGNLLQLHRDTPAQWDAWDLDRGYRTVVSDLTGAESIGPTEDGAGVRVVRRFGRSRIEQELRLVPGIGLRIDSTVDWQEREKLLKLAFPVDVHADRVASEIQFGHVERATHTNTSWDTARFETSQHRWQLAAEPGYGVALVNDSVYGSDSTRVPRAGGGAATLMRLSILRAARFPDPEQDRGVHRFSVGVVPGAGVQEAVQAGYRINLPRRTIRGGGPVRPLLEVEEPGVVVEAVKLAEDGSGDLVVRLYEALGRRASTAVRVGVEHDGVIETDLLEEPLDGTALDPVDGEHLELTLRAFQIVTLRITNPR